MSSSSPSDVPEPQHKPKRRLGCFSIGLLALIGMVGFVIAGFLIWRSVSARRLDTALAVLKADGHPTSIEELEATYKMPAGVNPGVIWVQAGEAMDASGPSILKLPFIGAEADAPPMPGEPWDQLEPSRAYLQKHANEIAMIEQAARTKKVARYETKLVVDDPEDSMLAFPYMKSHRHICRVMGMASYVYAHDNNPAGVANSIETGLRAALSLKDEPVSVAQLVATACSAMSLAQLSDFISMEFEDADLEKLQNTIREFDPQKSLMRGLEGEVVHAVNDFQNPKMTGPIPRLEDAAFFVEQTQPLLTAVQKGDWPEVRKAGKDVSLAADQIKAAGGPAAARYMLSSLALPSLAALPAAKVREAATLSVYDTLLASRRFQLENDRLPEKLSDLVPKFLPTEPTDPYSNSGQSLILMTEDSVTTIYSRGFNETDDGGDSQSSDGTGRPNDIVVTLSQSANK